MADRIITLKDDDNNPTFPIAGGMMADSVTTAMLKDDSVTTAKIADGAVTSQKIDWTTLPQLKSVTIGTATTTANGNISTTLPIAKTAPIVAYTDNNGAVASFYSYSGQTNWTLHLAAVSSGSALATTQVTGIKVYYLDSPENI